MRSCHSRQPQSRHSVRLYESQHDRDPARCRYDVSLGHRHQQEQDESRKVHPGTLADCQLQNRSGQRSKAERCRHQGSGDEFVVSSAAITSASERRVLSPPQPRSASFMSLSRKRAYSTRPRAPRAHSRFRYISPRTYRGLEASPDDVTWRRVNVGAPGFNGGADPMEIQLWEGEKMCRDYGAECSRRRWAPKSRAWRNRIVERSLTSRHFAPSTRGKG